MAIIVVMGLTTAFATTAAAPNTDAQEPVIVTNLDLDWVWPVEGCDTITTVFGKRANLLDGTIRNIDHIGIGGEKAAGANVYAALAGTVYESGFDTEHGNYMIITHDHGIQTIYRHLQKSLVSNGDSVTAGDTIGTVGQTGMATGAHLAFSVYVDGTAVNPLEYFD